ncbi:MAG: hypothetical protein ABIY63_11075 [Fibrobacteria bacterium]
MLESHFPSLDAADIARDWIRWRPVSRMDALRACRYRPVVVVYSVNSQLAAARFDISSPFFSNYGTFPYDNLRYYEHTGTESRKLTGPRATAREKVEFEPLVALNEAGEEVNLGSPVKKDKKKLPIEFQLVDLDGKALSGIPFEVVLPDGTASQGKSGADGWIRLKDNIHGGEAQLSLFPNPKHERINGPDGNKPVFNAKKRIPKELIVREPETGLEATALPTLGALPSLDDSPQPKIPVEIQVVDANGLPMPKTAFSVTFPDGEVGTGQTDSAGLISFPDNTQSGELLLVIDPKASA